MRRTPLLIGLLLVMAACTPGEAAPPDPGAAATAGTSLPATPVLPAAPGGATLESVRVLDGDSLEAVLDGATVEIRLLGINTPEREECWAAEARAAVAALVAEGPVTLREDGEDRFGRALGYVTAAGVFVNAVLVAEGHALAITGDHRYQADFAAAEQAAYSAGRGMWSADACGPATGAEVRIEEIDGNPPGRDDDPVSGESVVLLNRGGETVDLGGWVLRDESSLHRYEFPAGTTLGPGDRLRVASVCGASDHCFGDRETVWSNGGDTALLLDGSGNVVDRVRFDG